MGKWVSRLYGLILLYLAAEALWQLVLPDEFLPYAVLLMGVVILFTPLERDPRGFPTQSKFVYYTRKFVFGIVLVFMGIASTGIIGDWPLIVIGTQSGSLILAAIAVIYFLSAFSRTRAVGISSI